MILNRQTILTPHPDVIQTRLADGDTVLLDMASKRYFSLNETGARVWDLLKEKNTVAEIAADLQQRYEVSADDAAASVTRILSELISQQLVTAANP